MDTCKSIAEYRLKDNRIAYFPIFSRVKTPDGFGIIVGVNAVQNNVVVLDQAEVYVLLDEVKKFSINDVQLII